MSQFTPITPTEFVEKVTNYYLVYNNPPGWTPDAGCFYLGPEGQKCVIGCVLPAPLVRTPAGYSMFGGITSLCQTDERIGSFFQLVPIEFLDASQMAHDRSARLSEGSLDKFRTMFKENFRATLEQFSYPVPEVLKA